MEKCFIYTFSLGKLVIAQKGDAICHVQFSTNAIPPCPIQESPLLQEAARQLQAYFSGTLHSFDLPLTPEGTPFQLRVWRTLCNIPYGETRSYKEVATAIGQPLAARAVGMANNKNPIAIIIPCHRVIGSTGKLTGYAGGLSIKASLLALEKQSVRNDCDLPIISLQRPNQGSI